MYDLNMSDGFTVIGDIHGDLELYKSYMDQEEAEGRKTIMLGDLGFKSEHDWAKENMNTDFHRMINGNHDYPYYLDAEYNLGNYWVNSEYDCEVMTIRGAKSIDQHHRIEGRDWFREEELTIVEFNDVIRAVQEYKPMVIVSHDIPQFAKEAIWGYRDKTRTGQGLDAVWQSSRPLYWFYGHYHRNRTSNIDATTFICVGEKQLYHFRNNDT